MLRVAPDDFDSWLASLPDELPVSEGTTPGPWAMTWLRETFARDDSLSASALASRWDETVVSIASRTVDLVLDDYVRTTTREPRPVEVTSSAETGVKITWSGSYTSPSVFAEMNDATPTSVAVEAADYLQEHIVDELRGPWPVCSDHDAGLHAEALDDVPVWRCRRGNHVVAPIGQLPSEP
jgi:hypothetical protein